MTILLAAAAVFLALHLLVAGTRVRDAITAAIGENAYAGLFSFASLAAIVWLAMAYNRANGGADDRVLYDLGVGARHAAILVVGIAFFLGVQGLLMPNPTSVRQEAVAGREDAVRGVLRITRHPFLWGVAIWSAFHVTANGNLASVVFFGTFFLLAVLGTFSIDAKRRRKMGETWTEFAAKTSNIPFAAVIAGRNSLNAGESFGWRFGVALLVFLAVLFSHSRLFGVSPFPNGLVPF
jgi:uncharacterized membrane protein